MTIIEMASQLLTREDQDAAQILTEALRRDGVNARLNTKIKRVTVSGAKKLIHLESSGNGQVITVDEILVGVGRAPNVEGLNLEIVGVAYDKRKGITVKDRPRPSRRRPTPTTARG